MRVKHFVPLGLAMVLFFSSVQAQMAINFAQHMLIKISDKTLYGDPPAEKVEGTPFLNDNFVVGIVYGKDEKYTGIPMRYNMYDDNIEFKQNNQWPCLRQNRLVLIQTRHPKQFGLNSRHRRPK